MKRWPSLRTVLTVWVVVTAALLIAYVVYLREAPRDDLEVASTLSFQVFIAGIFVGIPSLVFLFLFLLMGAIAKHWLMGPNPSIERTGSGKPGPAAHVGR